MNRFLLSILAGLAIYFGLGIALLVSRWSSISGQGGAFLDSVVTNFVAESAFFVLVGAAGVLAQFYGESGDVLKQRLKRVFANKNVSLPVLDFFEDVAKSSSVYASSADHHITLLEFRPDLFAYRAEFCNEYHLRNAFGDIPYSAEISVEIAPDFESGAVDPLAVVHKLELEAGGKIVRFITQPLNVTLKGFKHPVRITLPKRGEAILRMRWWSWVDARGSHDSGFSMKRFAERFSVRVENKSPVTVRLNDRDNGGIIQVGYGDQVIIRELINVAPRTRVDFIWLPPAGHNPPAAAAGPSVLTGLLDFDRCIGDPNEQKL